MSAKILRRLCVVCVLFVARQAVADDNVLGLPTPRDPARPGAVLLHGGGRITGDVFDRFVALAGGRQARIVLVPSAGYSADDLAIIKRRYSSWVRLTSSGSASSFEFLTTDDPADANDPAFVAPLLNATGVWFSGGYQSRISHRYVATSPRQTLVQQALRQVVERGGVVGGTSAGMAALPQLMTLWQEQPTAKGPATAVVAHGLGLFDQAIVEQHFDTIGGRFERFTTLLRDDQRLDHLAGRRGIAPRMVGLAVEQGGALLVVGDQLQVLGAGSAHVFLKSAGQRSVAWHELTPGESGRLQRDAAGMAHLQRNETAR